MILTITHKGSDAAALLRLLQLPADAVQSSALPFGKATAFCSELLDDRATACLLMELAPAQLSAPTHFTGAGHPLRQFVHSRAYTANAHLAMALGTAFEATIAAAEQQRLAMEIELFGVHTRVDATTMHTWCKPLGWQLTILPTEEEGLLDLRLRGTQPLALALAHVQYLLIAMDEDSRYWMGDALLKPMYEQAATHLADHPHREGFLAAMAAFPEQRLRHELGQLFEEDDHADGHPWEMPHLPKEILAPWHTALAHAFSDPQFTSILLLPSTNHDLLLQLASLPHVAKLGGTNADVPTLQALARRIQETPLDVAIKQKILLFPATMHFRNPQFVDYQGVVVQQAPEMMSPSHLPAFTQVVFSHVAPKRVLWLGHGHQQFENWASATAKEYGYQVQLIGLEQGIQGSIYAMFDQKIS